MNATNAIIRVTESIIDMTERLSLRQVVEKIRPVPNHLILVGMAEDGEPVWLNSQNSPNVIIWDKLARQGLRILKVIAEYLFLNKKREQLEFLVLTLYPDDWGDLNKYGMGMDGTTSCIGVVPFHSELARKVVNGLSRWIHEKHNGTKQPIVVLIDGLENLEEMSDDFKIDLRYIFARGQSKRVYIVGTAHKKNFHKVQEWLDGFQVAVYGKDVADTFQMEEGTNTVLFYAPKTEIL